MYISAEIKKNEKERYMNWLGKVRAGTTRSQSSKRLRCFAKPIPKTPNNMKPRTTDRRRPCSQLEVLIKELSLTLAAMVSLTGFSSGWKPAVHTPYTPTVTAGG